MAAFHELCQQGVHPVTMRDAHIELVKLVSAHKGVQRRSVVTDTVGVCVTCCRPRRTSAPPGSGLMQQVQDRCTYSVLRSRAGHLISNRRGIARELVEHWSCVMSGGSETEHECLQWLRNCGLPALWRTLVPLLWKPCTSELGCSGLEPNGPLLLPWGRRHPGGCVPSVYWLLCSSHGCCVWGD